MVVLSGYIFFLLALIPWDSAVHACKNETYVEIETNPLYPDADFQLPQEGHVFKLIFDKYATASCDIFRKKCGVENFQSALKPSDRVNHFDFSLLVAYSSCLEAQRTGDHEAILKHCPSRCKRRPCMDIEHARPYSCTHLKNESLVALGRYFEDFRIESDCFRSYGKSIKSLAFADFRCECYDGYRWDQASHRCLRDPRYDRCYDIVDLCNTGSCQSTPSGSKCVCPPAFTGKYCEKYTDPCLDSARSDTCSPFKCFRDPSSHQHGYTCLCTAGHKLDELSDHPRCVPVNMCEEAQPCLHGSNCTQDTSSTGYRCQCLPGYTGHSCEHEIVIPPGEWGVWQPWGNCEGVCGSFVQYSNRACLHNKTCYGASQRRRACPVVELCQPDYGVFRDYDVFYEGLLNQSILTFEEKLESFKSEPAQIIDGETVYSWIEIGEAFDSNRAFILNHAILPILIELTLFYFS